MINNWAIAERNRVRTRKAFAYRSHVVFRRLAIGASVACALALFGGAGQHAHAQEAEPQHGIAMHGAPAQGPEFTHLSYADPSAPKGGRMVFGEVGRFDSMNPYAATGSAPWHLGWMVFESLMVRSWDEPFTLYGLLAENVATPPDRSYVEFTIRPEARFSNGQPVTPDDVIWTWETLKEKGKLNLRGYYEQVERIERIGERGVRFVFKEPDRELPLLLGIMPILPKSVYEGRDFSAGDLETPIGSGPYIVESFEPGSTLLYRRDPNYWGRDLAVNAGRHNFDVVEHIYFGDRSILFESFAGGIVDHYADLDPAHWAEAYDIPAVADGRIVKVEVKHRRPSSMRGFVFNTRRALFADRRVREAIALAFDFTWINERYYRGGYARILSTFSGSPLGFDGAATGAEAALLAPFAADLPPGTLEEGWRPAAGKGDGRNRRNLRRARALLEEAGWTLQDGVLRNADGVAFTFEIMLRTPEEERLATALQGWLKPLGIQATLRKIDAAQYTQRRNDYDYDMIFWQWGVSLSPGQEQRFYWGASGRDTPRSRNYMGVADPALDAMIDALLAAESREDFEAAVRALDRVLASGVYVIPFGYLPVDQIAYNAELGRPDYAPIYGHIHIDTWWRKPE